MHAKSGIRDIAVVFKTHLDIGFTDFAENVLRTYIESYIPAALALAQRTRDTPSRFVWTTGSWLAWRFLEDAPRAMRRKMEEAIEAGDFHWHALPFTTHTELMDARLFRAGLAISQRLDARFGRTTCSAKLTDVPGHTCSMIPLLAEAGVRLLHIGINPASAVPETPPVFRWRFGGAEVVVVYNGDYGTLTALPGGRALSVNLTGDNLGPQAPDQVTRVYESLQKEYPGARVAPASLCEVARQVWGHRDALPVLTQEIGDSWIHGVGTDPIKVSRYRALNRLRGTWLEQGVLREGGATDRALSEALLLTAEHTWGLDLKTHLNDWRHYRRKDFERVCATAPFRKMERSWEEQRAYVTSSVARLPTRLRAKARAEFKDLAPRIVMPPGRKSDAPDAVYELGGWKLSFHPGHGALVHLESPSGVLLATERNPLAALFYQAYSAEDYRRFYRQYIRGDAEWMRQDFTKPGLPASIQALRVQPNLQRLVYDPVRACIRMAWAFGGVAVSARGAPALVHGEWTVQAGKLALRLEWQKKAAYRGPEALWLEFHPRNVRRETWEVEKLGRWISMRDVVARGGGGLHAMDRAVRLGPLSIASLDAPLVAPGTGSLLRFGGRKGGGDGVSVNLVNNVWGTNFPMWFGEQAGFRFELSYSN